MQKLIRGKPEHMVTGGNVLVDLCFWVKGKTRADIVSALAAENGPPCFLCSLHLSLFWRQSLLAHIGLSLIQ